MAQLLASTNWTAKRLWHKVTSSEPIGGGRYLRYNLACGYNPHGDPLPNGEGFLQTSMKVVTATAVVDAAGDPPSRSKLSGSAGASDDMVRVCAVCFPRSALRSAAY